MIDDGQVATMSVRDVIGEIVDRAVEQRVPISKAIDPELVTSLNGALRDELVRQGIIYLGNNELHDRQKGKGHTVDPDGVGSLLEGGPTVQNGHPHPREERDVLSRIRFATRDGTQLLPVIEIHVNNLKEIADEARGFAHGWRRRAQAMELAIRTCEQSGAERLKDLPTEKLHLVREEFESVWGAS